MMCPWSGTIGAIHQQLLSLHLFIILFPARVSELGLPSSVIHVPLAKIVRVEVDVAVRRVPLQAVVSPGIGTGLEVVTYYSFSTEMRFILCTWFCEFCFCCSLTALPGLAWVLLSKIYIHFCSPLYISITYPNVCFPFLSSSSVSSPIFSAGPSFFWTWLLINKV